MSSTAPDAGRIAERTDFVTRVAHDLVTSQTLPDDKFVFRRGRIEPLVKGYFILSECYKNWRIHDGHNTEPAKIAAIAACAAIKFQIFSPMNRTHASTVLEARCNEFFAIYLAAAIIEVKVDITAPAGRDLWFRIIDILHSWKGETLEPFATDINMQIDRDIAEYFRTVHSEDQIVINSLICIFELLNGKLSKATP